MVAEGNAPRLPGAPHASSIADSPNAVPTQSVLMGHLTYDMTS